MRINEILLETPGEIKLLIGNMGYSIYFIRNKSDAIKRQFRTHHSRIHVVAMKTYLGELNLRLMTIADLPQWAEWIKYPDGKMVWREMNQIFNSNNAFVKRFGKD